MSYAQKIGKETVKEVRYFAFTSFGVRRDNILFSIELVGFGKEKWQGLT